VYHFTVPCTASANDSSCGWGGQKLRKQWLFGWVRQLDVAGMRHCCCHGATLVARRRSQSNHDLNDGARIEPFDFSPAP